MSEPDDKDSTNINRRAFLRRSATTGVVGGLGLQASSSGVSAASCGIDSSSSNYSEIDYEWKDETSVTEENIPSGSGTEYAIETQSAVIHMTSNYVSQDDRWTHYFYEGAHVVTKNKASWESDSAYTLHENVNNHTVTIDNRDPNRTSLFVTDNSYDVGAVPSPNGSTASGYGDAAWTVIRFALTSQSRALQVGTAAADVAYHLLNNGESDSGEIQEYAWPYSPSFPCEAAHYCHFMIRGHDDYAKANVNVYEYSVADAGNVNNSLSWSIHVDPFNGGIQSFDGPNETTGEAPEQGTDEYTEMLAGSDQFVEIPYQEIENPSLRELADGEPVYRAVNPAVQITSEPTAPDEYSPW